MALKMFARVENNVITALRGRHDAPQGFLDVTGQNAQVGDEIMPDGVTVKEREPDLKLFRRATAAAIKALAQGQPIPAKAQAILQKVYDTEI